MTNSVAEIKHCRHNANANQMAAVCGLSSVILSFVFPMIYLAAAAAALSSLFWFKSASDTHDYANKLEAETGHSPSGGGIGL